MKDISSFKFVGFQKRLEHQNLVDMFFLSNAKENKILNIKIENSKSIFFEISSSIGEIRFTILGSNEKDYNFYSEEIINEATIEKISTVVYDEKVDNIKIPLLSKKGAIALKKLFEKKMKNFIFKINLNSVTPIIDKRIFSKKRASYIRQIKKFERKGGEFKKTRESNKLIKSLHNKRWGRNRSDDFFNYLSYLDKKKLSESFGLFIKNKLIAYIQMIATGDTIHYYYSIFDEKYNGAGSAIICYSIKNYIENENLRFFSFGRGSEWYKHRWSTNLIKNYELRGFLS
jgi:hypothetical protein